MSKSVKDQTVKAFQVGGAVNPQTGVYQVPGTGITGFQPAPGLGTGYTPNQPIQPYFTPTQFTQAQYQDPLQVTNIPTFADTVGSGFGQYDEEKTYINDAGQILKVPFKDGKPLYPIPEGYSEQGEAPKEEQTPTATITPTTGQTQVTDGGGRDDDFYTTPKGGGVTVKNNKGESFTTTTLKQNQEKYGYTGKQGINLATAMSVLSGNVLGALGSVSGFMPEKIGPVSIEMFSEPARPGMTGTVDRQTLEAIASGQFVSGFPGQSSIGINQQMANDILSMQTVIGTPLTGITGYKPGDLNPVTGSFVNEHGAALDGFVTGTHSYTTIKDMIDTVKKGIDAGWRGGYVSKDVYDDVLTDAQKKNYDNFDPTHSITDEESKPDVFKELDKGGEEDMSSGAIAREEAQIQEMVDTGQVPADVQEEIDKAMKEQYDPDPQGKEDSGPDNSGSSSGSGERGGPPGAGGSGYAQGGLAKQMKRSELASKK
jgi:hypothetical protein